MLCETVEGLGGKSQELESDVVRGRKSGRESQGRGEEDA